MLDHGEAKVLITDTEFAPTVQRGAARSRRESRWSSTSPTRWARAATGSATSTTKRSSPAATRRSPGSRPATNGTRSALNYTSGTTGNPKGVVYHHRGAYLNALSNIVDWGMPRHAVYLWTLPMFHCNGWCFPWTMAANAGTNVCLRKVEAGADPRRDSRARGHALLRRADRARAADQRAGRSGSGASTHQVQLPGRGGRAAGRGDRRHAADGLRHHPRLRADRDLRAGRGVRQAPGVGRARHRRAAPSATAARACAIPARKA